MVDYVCEETVMDGREVAEAPEIKVGIPHMGISLLIVLAIVITVEIFILFGYGSDRVQNCPQFIGCTIP